MQGIGVVICVYYNSDCDKFWDIDYRIYDKEADGKKLDHLKDMLSNTIHGKDLLFSNVFINVWSWYVTVNIIYTVHDYKKIFYCPIKSNRQVSEKYQEYHHILVKGFALDLS